MTESKTLTDEACAQTWRRFAASEEGFVGPLLGVLGERQGRGLDVMREEFGASAEGFERLLAFPRPRAGSVAADAARIAEACGLENSLAFVRAMVMAVAVAVAPEPAAAPAYRAAFDPDEGLDEVPGGEGS